MLWFFEGFTSYYDDLLLRRSGLIDNGQYLEVLCKTVNHVWQSPGRKVQSVAQASFDAWIKYYRPEPNTPNTTVSYYTKGALVALCFDLTLRHEGQCNLDDVMRALWVRSHQAAARGAGVHVKGAITERDFAQVLEELGGRSFKKEIAAWIHGTDELPVQHCLALYGVQLHKTPATWQQHLGMRVTEKAGEGIIVKTVLSNSVAEKAGFAPGDEWLGIELSQGNSTKNQQLSWRIHKIEDLSLHVGDVSQNKSFNALVARDMKLLKLPLQKRNTKQAIKAPLLWRFEIQDSKRLHQWIANEE